jgi:peptidoglycan/LPS O-acetylase OafA/YrhL
MNKRDFSIEFIRVAAMFMIIIDHILCRITFPGVALIIQVCNSGVFLFLFISGFLFGKKEIKNWCEWFKKRCLRILIPLWIFAAIDILIEYLLWHQFYPEHILLYAFNLQGIKVATIGSINLWFVTLIMICYLITPLIQWVKMRSGMFLKAVVTLLIVLQMILAYVTDIGLFGNHTLSWCIIAVLVYGTGYIVGDKILAYSKSYKSMIISLMILLIGVLATVFGKKLLNETVFYERILSVYGMICIDQFLILLFYKLGSYIHNIKLKNIIQHFDRISYEFYIVHGIVISAVTETILRNNGTIIYMFTSVLFSYVVAIILHIFCKVPLKTMYKQKR